MCKVSHSVGLINCPDLRGLVRGVYRTGRDPAAEAGVDDLWMTTLPGRFGLIYPFGHDRLAVEVSDPRIASRIAAVKGAIPYQRGEWYWSFTFDVYYLDTIAAIICPRKFRRLSAGAKKRLAAIGRSTRFGAPNTAPVSASGCQDASSGAKTSNGSSGAAKAVLELA
jgi:hypothetical protein